MSEYIMIQKPLVRTDGTTEGFKVERGEEIVRCRDCEHLNIVGKCPGGFWALENLNGFCAWASRKVDE